MNKEREPTYSPEKKNTLTDSQWETLNDILQSNLQRLEEKRNEYAALIKRKNDKKMKLNDLPIRTGMYGTIQEGIKKFQSRNLGYDTESRKISLINHQISMLNSTPKMIENGNTLYIYHLLFAILNEYTDGPEMWDKKRNMIPKKDKLQIFQERMAQLLYADKVNSVMGTIDDGTAEIMQDRIYECAERVLRVYGDEHTDILPIQLARPQNDVKE